MMRFGLAAAAAALFGAGLAAPATAADATSDCTYFAKPTAANPRHLVVEWVCGAQAAQARLSTPLVTWYVHANWDTYGGTISGNAGTCDKEGYHVTLNSYARSNISSWRVEGACRNVRAYNSGGASQWFGGNVSYPGPNYNDNVAQMRITS